MTATRLLICAAALMGAAGVVLAALASHAHAGTSLGAAASILSLHAPAVLAIAVARKAGLMQDGLARLSAWGLVLGAGLFATAIALPLMAGVRFFPMAAPIGGTVMIGAWLLAAVAGLVGGER